MIGRHVKQRLVAENRALDDHRGDRGHDGRSEQRRVHVADDLFEGEQDGGDGSVERRRQRARRADRHQILRTRRGDRRSHRPTDRRQTGADLH